MGDARLSRRLVKRVTRLAESPSASIPQACRGWAEMRAAYRVLGQESSTGRTSCSSTGMRRAGVCVSTKWCCACMTRRSWTSSSGLGPPSYEAQRGISLHPTYASTSGRVPLDVIDAWMRAREFKGEDGNRPGLRESLRWIEGYERVARAGVASAGHAAGLRGQSGDRHCRAHAQSGRAGHADGLADPLVQHDRSLGKGDPNWV